MAFVVPTFNLNCNIFSGDIWPPPPVRLVSPCNLAMGRRTVLQIASQLLEGNATFGVQPLLLLPAGTDVRDDSCGHVQDFIECPAGSGRWYQVLGVDDSGKGFANEFRIATMCKIFDGSEGTGTFPGLFWPTPIP
jgi:hypothetical protein